ncbi:SGT1 protein-domain-containing protein [Peziza echinospora]|nr:SGT1 protein-domain-containing protein [Peziza echinospora]
MEEDPFTPGYGEFQGIPKRTLPDDTVEYSIYVLDSSYPSQTRRRARLEVVKKAADGLVGEWGGEYIWQRENFGLEIVEDDGSIYLKGKTEFGEAIDDEWFIVAILRELSRRFQDLWIRVVDNDGEFLLIEAANALPPWVKPEIMDFRVWINSGQLFLVAEKNATTPITLKEALATINAADKAKIQRIRLVEEEAFYRVSKYPEAAHDHLHHALAKVPRKVALVLSERPQYVSAAVEQFYLRDPISLKACQKMKNFNPKDSVLVSVKFTKVLYAQLRSQEFAPPEGAGFKIPSEELKGKRNPDFAPADIGMKLACGFEMLIAPESVKTEKEELISDEIENILKNNTPPTDEEIATWPKTSDSEDWLDIDYTEFEKNLQGKSGKDEKAGSSKDQSTGYGHKSAEEKLKKMVQRFEMFLNDDESAGVDGVNINGSDEESDEDGSEDESMGDDEDEEDKGVSFDEAEFEKMMREMMGLPPDENVVKSQEMEDAEKEEEEIRKIQSQVEAELKEAGVITSTEQPKIKELRDDEDEEMDIDDGDEVDIDFNLAKNMLESLKSQGGMSGPGSNLLASMGIVFPRDDAREIDGKGKGKASD